MNTDQPRFADRMLQCKKCGTQFIFTVSEQREMAESGLSVSDPELCPNCRQEKPTTTATSGRQRGRVKWFSRQRGYGFIIVESTAEEIFVHRTDLEGVYSLREGQEVEFEIEDTPKGPEAVRVSPLRPGAKPGLEY
jgi:CspA family cold shock protein